MLVLKTAALLLAGIGVGVFLGSTLMELWMRR
jgi:hypothetical protein